ncbi:MAG: hypothetical protein CMJ18_24685 [Phycisphaeraceae bacterium]|nr:hypothetical protein [Phycisphaeraceae bacterium]
MPDPYCQQCGYSLVGATRPVCPECGAPFNPDAPFQKVGGNQVFRRILIGALVMGLVGLGLFWLILMGDNFGPTVALMIGLPIVAFFSWDAWQFSRRLALARSARASAAGTPFSPGAFRTVCCVGIVIGQLGLGAAIGAGACFGCVFAVAGIGGGY